MTYEPMHSAQEQSVRVKKYIFWFCWSQLSRHYKKLERMYVLSMIPSQIAMF